MFDDLKSAGMPLGPLARPTPLFHKGGRGKYHYEASCQPGLLPRDAALADLDEAELCSKCESGLDYDVSRYTKLARETFDRYRRAQLRIDNPTSGSDPERELWTLMVWAWQAANPAVRDDWLVEDRHALGHWGTVHLAPKLDAAVQSVKAHVGLHLADGWSFRRACVAAALGEEHTRFRDNLVNRTLNPALRPPWRGVGRGRDGTQGAIPPAMRTLFLDGLTADTGSETLVRHAIEAGLTILENIEGPEDDVQLPLDRPMPTGDFATIRDAALHAWREAGREEIVDMATRFAEEIREERSEAEAEEESIVLWALSDDLRVRDGIAGVIPYAVGRGPFGTMITRSPAIVVRRAVLEDSSVLGRHADFGIPKSGDTAETYRLAAELFMCGDLSAEDAIAAARGALL